MRVIGRQALYDLLTEQGRSEEEEIPEALALTVARGAGARMLLWGSVTGTRADMRIDAQLVELENGTVLFAEAVRGSDVFALVDSLTQSLFSRLRGGRPEPPQVRLSRMGTEDLDALAAFQRGFAAERAGRMDEAEAHFEEAVRIDSTFILPSVRLASIGEVEAVDAPDAARVRVRSDSAHVAAVHRRRALELIQGMDVEWVGLPEDITQEELLERLDSTLAQALSSVEVWVGELERDSLGRPIPPPANRRPPPNR